MDTIYLILLNAFMVLCAVTVFCLPIYLVFGGGMDKFALRPLKKCFYGIQMQETPAPSDVTFTYFTYRGLLIWFTQDEHQVNASYDDAKTVLGRLLRFNLTWGMLSYGLLFVPFIAFGNYRAQLKSIEAQRTAVGG